MQIYFINVLSCIILDVFSLTFYPTFLNFNWIGSYSHFNLLKILMNLDLLEMVSVMFQLFTAYLWETNFITGIVKTGSREPSE